jgi:hypothetical protein
LIIDERSFRDLSRLRSWPCGPLSKCALLISLPCQMLRRVCFECVFVPLFLRSLAPDAMPAFSFEGPTTATSSPVDSAGNESESPAPAQSEHTTAPGAADELHILPSTQHASAASDPSADTPAPAAAQAGADGNPHAHRERREADGQASPPPHGPATALGDPCSLSAPPVRRVLCDKVGSIRCCCSRCCPFFALTYSWMPHCGPPSPAICLRSSFPSSTIPGCVPLFQCRFSG